MIFWWLTQFREILSNHFAKQSAPVAVISFGNSEDVLEKVMRNKVDSMLVEVSTYTKYQAINLKQSSVAVSGCKKESGCECKKFFILTSCSRATFNVAILVRRFFKKDKITFKRRSIKSSIRKLNIESLRFFLLAENLFAHSRPSKKWPPVD